MIVQGDTVYLVADAIDHDGNVITPETSGRGVVVGWVGAAIAVVQWGAPGTYRYADVPLSDLRKYQR